MSEGGVRRQRRAKNDPREVFDEGLVAGEVEDGEQGVDGKVIVEESL